MGRRGRPPTAALLEVADVFDAIADRIEADLPVASIDIAVDLGISRTSLRRIVYRDTGLEWTDFILAILATPDVEGADDRSMKRITVALSDTTFHNLRRAALRELRDPRLEARRLLEQALDAQPEPTPLDERTRGARPAA